uniref:Uncharacterized protein n=1 Tax=Tanacetum cinerariifolium TaxID=118510 RepID=A0A6L2JZJ1_TANCI|nr:hypothetical protein [Tanacetum cinerariifolium]
MYVASLKRSKNYKARPYQYALPSKQILKAKAKPYLPCTQCGFNDHRPDDCRNYPECSSESSIGMRCTTCESNVHSTTDHNDFEHFKRARKIQATKAREPIKRVFNTRRQQIKETYHVTFDESMKAIRFTNISVDEIGINDSSITPLDEFLYEDDLFRKYQANSDISYYITPHGCLLTKLTKDTHVPKVITSNKQNTPHTKDIKGPLDLINMEGTPPKDRSSRDKHIELVKIIGEPTEGMLTRSMAAKLTVVSTSKCLFADFLSEIEPKKKNYEKIITKFKSDHVIGLNRILINLKEVEDVVKEDHALTKKVFEAAKAYTKNSTNLTELLSLSVSPQMTKIKNTQAAIQSNITTLKTDTTDIKAMMTKMESSDHTATITPIEETSSQTKGEKDDMIMEETMSKTADVKKEHVQKP